MSQEEDLKHAIALVKVGLKEDAVPILKNMLKANRDNEPAWFWLSGCVDKPEDKVYCLQEAFRINPNNEQTKKSLDQLKANFVQPTINQKTIHKSMEEGMNDKLQAYLRKTREFELIKRGLYDKKFYKPEEVTKEMKLKLRYDDESQRFYENIPYEVTNEEYNEIIKIPYGDNVYTEQSSLPGFFFWTGTIFFILAILGGIAIASPTSYQHEINWQLVGTVWISAFLFFLIMLGIAKIIELLIKIYNKS